MVNERYDAFPSIPENTPTLEPSEGSDSRTVVGYAVVWGAISTLRADGFRHVFERGSIVWAPVVNALWHHSLLAPLASTGNGSLRVVEDDIGARVSIDLDETTDGQNALIRVRNRLVVGMSVGIFRAPNDWAPTEDPTVRRITRAIANEVTLTVDPAMAATRIVTADDGKNLAREMKERKAREAKQRLNQVRLTLLRPR